jgi:SAM-dependent methyltransferase
MVIKVMSNVFNPKNQLESEFRKKILPVDPLIALISKLPKRDIAIDVGAGTGYFTIHLAKLFRKVYAIEISLEVAKYLMEEASSNDLVNIGVIISNKPELDFNVDFILFSDVLHEMRDPQSYINWAAKKGEIIAVIDWKANAPLGPPANAKISEEVVIEMLKNTGLEIEKIECYTYHYFIVGRGGRRK